jgi:hypothetical protein
MSTASSAIVDSPLSSAATRIVVEPTTARRVQSKRTRVS